jgi:hypothetical protein
MTITYKKFKGYVRWIIKPDVGQRITGSCKTQAQAEKRVGKILTSLKEKQHENIP